MPTLAANDPDRVPLAFGLARAGGENARALAEGARALAATVRPLDVPAIDRWLAAQPR